MNVLSIVLGSDPAGISAGMARAFDHHGGDWSLRSMVTSINYIQYLQDELFERERAAELWTAADVVHLHHSFISADRIIRGGFVGSGLKSKPYVVEFHGQEFRKDPHRFLRDLTRRKAVGGASTVDLVLIAPHVLTWMPAPVDVETMRAMRMLRDDGRVLIAHAPTNRAIKSTEVLLEAVKRLQEEGLSVELDLIEGRPWAECLERKAKADIYFDQVKLGYGNNSIEAWGMGIPVIAGAQPATLTEMERRFDRLPFYSSTEASIYDSLKALVQSSDLRAEYGQVGLEHVRAWHDEAKVVEQLKDVYSRAMDG